MTITTPRRSRHWELSENIDGINVVRFNSKLGKLRYFSLFLHLIFQEIAPDIINAHYVIPTGLGGLFWSKIHRIPLVFTLIGDDVFDPFLSPHILMQSLMRMALHRCNSIFYFKICA